MRFLLPYAQLVRLPNTFTVIADIFLGALATGFLSGRGRWFLAALGSQVPESLRKWLPASFSSTTEVASVGAEFKQWCMLGCLMFASIFLYWSGMIWNDYFDLDQDRKERPGRPLASGRVTMRTAVYLAFGLMAAGLLLAFTADRLSPTGRWIAFPIAATLVAAIFLYDGLVKATIAGPIAMGLCRSLNILLGLSIVGEWPPFTGWLIALIVGIYIGGVTWFARTEARDSSRSMLIGAAIAMLISLVLSLAVPALVVERTSDLEPSRLFPYLLAGFGCYLGVAVIAAIRRPEPSRVQTVIVRAIMGLVVLDALLASAFVGSIGLLLVVLLIPGLVLGRWLYST
jgi:4-hydroxybenzoate polyprenyltransferase